MMSKQGFVILFPRQYNHCKAHNLNISIVHAFKEVLVRNMFAPKEVLFRNMFAPKEVLVRNMFETDQMTFYFNFLANGC